MSIAAYDFTWATITEFDYTQKYIQAEGETIHCLLETGTMDEATGTFTLVKKEGQEVPFREGDKVKIHLERLVIQAQDIHGGIGEVEKVKLQLNRKGYEFEGMGEITEVREEAKRVDKEEAGRCTIRIRWATADEIRGG